MVFVDSNIPMYLIGAAHPHKVDAQRLLERCIADGQRLVTSVEVMQEILHRYVAINRRDAIQPAFEVLLSVTDEVFPIEIEDVEAARDIVLAGHPISARDALHAAVMNRRDVEIVLSFDSGFDRLPGITRMAHRP